MGIQVAFNRTEAMKAGMLCCEGRSKTFEWCDVAGDYVHDGWRTFRCIQLWDEDESENTEIIVSAADYGDDETIIVDFNRWGSNRGPLENWLLNNHISYEEF